MTRIRVGIDASPIQFPGIGRYVRCLLLGLRRHGGEIELVVYGPQAAAQDPIFSGLRMHAVSGSPYSPTRQIVLARRIRRDRLDIFHSPSVFFPLLSSVPLAVTIHDVVFRHFPLGGGRTAPLRTAGHQLLHDMAARRASAVVTVSEFSRREILRHLRVDPGRVEVVANAVEPHFTPRPAGECEALRSRLGLPGDFVLYMGTTKPWKNLSGLLAAFGEVVRVRPGCRLVLAGRRSRFQDEVEEQIDGMRLTGSVVRLDELPEHEMPALYSSARMLVMPSLYEGFGLPALEAMACGTAVICSNIDSLAGVVGTAGILVDPMDRDGWRDAICRLWDDESLRSSYAERGLLRARDFPVEALAEGIIAVYRKALTK